MLISFLGSLPLGTLNIASMQIAITYGVWQAMQFSIGSLISEMIYVRLSLVAMDWIRQRQKIFRMLEWLTFVIVLLLAFSSFRAALSEHPKENLVLSSNLPKFILGLAMSAVSPAQIPFWFGWSTVLLTKNVLKPTKPNYYSYIFGIGIGTLLGNAVFIFGGRIVADKLENSHRTINWVIGGIFLITAIIQLWKMLNKKDAIEQLEHPEEIKEKYEKKLDL